MFIYWTCPKGSTVSNDTLGTPLVSFTRHIDRHGLDVRDIAEGVEYEIRTPSPVVLESEPADGFPVPVDAAVSFTTTEIRIPSNVALYLRDESNEHLGDFFGEARELPRGTYYIETGSTSKLYIRVFDAALTGYHPDTFDSDEPAVFSLDRPTRVDIGARSAHTRPTETITVPDDPEAMMEAISYLGSSIKEFSCERSWPTIRGHPPAIEVDDRLDVPDALTKPDTGITVAVPPTYEAVYAVAPLAYYLGATVVPGESPELRTDFGFTHPLVTRRHGLEASVDRLLARCLVLDSLTRIGGYYTVSRHEYDQIAPHLSYYPENLYGRPIGEQLLEYLEVPIEMLEPFLPDWPTTVTLRPVATDAELLPYLLNDLARIRVRAADADRPDSGSPSETGGGDTMESEERLRTSTTVDATVTEGVLLREGFEHSFEFTPQSADETRIVFASIDDARRDELERVAETYRARDAPATFDVHVESGLTTAELGRVLESDVGFLYLAGRVTREGVVCTDGVFSVDDVDRVGVTTFFLTTCETYDVGVELVEAGAVNGVVSRRERTPAPTDAGRLVDVLIHGYSLADGVSLSGFELGRDEGLLVGDPLARVVQPDVGRTFAQFDVESVDVDTHWIAVTTTASHAAGVGGLLRLSADFTPESNWLVGTRLEHPVPVSSTQVVKLLSSNENPVHLNGEPFRWSTTVTAEEVRDSAQRALDGTE